MKVESQIGPFEVGTIIGSGMIGVALVARHIRTKRVFCLKCMHREKIIEKNLGVNIRQEVEFMMELNDQDYIMPLEQLITRERELIMVFPYFPGRDLYRFMKTHKSPKGYLTEYESWVITKQLIAALKVVHSRNILHRDIKPENIMLDDNLNMVLSDFGIAVRMSASGKHTGRAGTPCYYPYEMVAGL